MKSVWILLEVPRVSVHLATIDWVTYAKVPVATTCVCGILIIIMIILVSDCNNLNYFITSQYVDVDECTSERLHNCSTDNNQICVNTPGSYFCHCAAGFEEIGATCQGTINVIHNY